MHDHAEILLKQRSLSSYYDDVALKGLRLAVIDAERGVLTPVPLERIRASIESPIEDLDDYEDVNHSRPQPRPQPRPTWHRMSWGILLPSGRRRGHSTLRRRGGCGAVPCIARRAAR